MIEKKEKKDLCGIVLLDKAEGITSNKALQRVKGFFNAKKAGHTGTLDPMATGLLPICFGRATKIAQYLLNEDKAYQATLQLGIKTDTGDKEGNIISEQSFDDLPSPTKITKKACETVCEKFLGIQAQVPPMHSALKVEGKRLYELARSGQTIERKARQITIYMLQVLQYDAEKHQLMIEVKCSKGTYIRTLAENIAESLGTVAHLIALRRIQVGALSIEKSVVESDLTTLNILPVSKAFQNFECAQITQDALIDFQKTGNLDLEDLELSGKNGFFCLYLEEVFVGILNVSKGKILTRLLFY